MEEAKKVNAAKRKKEELEQNKSASGPVETLPKDTQPTRQNADAAQGSSRPEATGALSPLKLSDTFNSSMPEAVVPPPPAPPPRGCRRRLRTKTADIPNSFEKTADPLGGTTGTAGTSGTEEQRLHYDIEV